MPPQLKSGPAIATWEPPSWAATRDLEEDSVEYRRHVGDLRPAEDTEVLCVDVVQRDELDLATTPASIRRTAPMVSLAGIRLSPNETRSLTQLLTSALSTIGAAP